MDPCSLPSRALSRRSAERTRTLPGGLCRHGHPSAGKELLESGEGSLQVWGVWAAPPSTPKCHAAPLPARQSWGPVSLPSSWCNI